jgi:hypothetical protein
LLGNVLAFLSWNILALEKKAEVKIMMLLLLSLLLLMMMLPALVELAWECSDTAGGELVWEPD